MRRGLGLDMAPHDTWQGALTNHLLHHPRTPTMVDWPTPDFWVDLEDHQLPTTGKESSFHFGTLSSLPAGWFLKTRLSRPYHPLACDLRSSTSPSQTL